MRARSGRVNELVSERMSDSFIFTICDPNDFDCPQYKNTCKFIIIEEKCRVVAW